VSLPEHRAGDADRERVAALLREAHAEGRLDVDELSQRLDAAFRARTFGELAALHADLPPSAPPTRPRSRPPGSPPASRPSAGTPVARRDQGLRAAWAVWAVAVSVNVVVWALVSVSAADLVYFWPMWVAGPWGAVLLALTVTSGWRGR
jgi:hypothetical protein